MNVHSLDMLVPMIKLLIEERYIFAVIFLSNDCDWLFASTWFHRMFNDVWPRQSKWFGMNELTNHKIWFTTIYIIYSRRIRLFNSYVLRFRNHLPFRRMPSIWYVADVSSFRIWAFDRFNFLPTIVFVSGSFRANKEAFSALFHAAFFPLC